MPPYDANTDNEANRLSTVMMSNAQAAVDQFRQDYQNFPANGANLLNATTDHVADRVSNVMINNPDLAADQLRADLQVLDPQTGSSLIAKIKNDETNKTAYYGQPGLGDLQIQPEIDQYGNDTGYRNVTMATPNGIQQIAEIQARPLQPQDPGYGDGTYGPNTLGFAAGMIVGDLLWQSRMGLNFGDDRYRGWCNREMGREQYWQQNQGQFQAHWNDPSYRATYESQNNWQNIHNSTTINNSYVNNRVDTTIINRPVNTTIINETINNNPRPAAPHQPITYPGVGRPVVGGQGGEVQGHPAPIVHPGVPAGTAQPGRIAPAEQNPVVRTPAAPVEHAPPPALQHQLQLQQERDNAARQAQQLQEQQREAAARQAQQLQEQQREAAARQAQQLQEQQREAAARQAQQLQEQQREAAARQAQQAHPPAPAAAPPAAPHPAEPAASNPKPKLPGEKS